MDKVIEIARFGYVDEAQQLVDLLHAEGIEASIRNETMSSLFPGINNIGEPSVDILEKDIQRALEVMKDAGYEIPTGKEGLEGLKTVSGFMRHIPILNKLPFEKQIWAFFFILIVLIFILAMLTALFARSGG